MNTQLIRRTLAATVLTAGLVSTGAALETVSAPAAPSTVTAATAVAPQNATEDGAVSWAESQLGADEYYEQCQAFVHDAYLNGSGYDIGSADSAVDYWNAHTAQQHPGDTNPPAGALVYWGATSSNPYGHVGISEGGDTVISSYEESTTTIHEFSLAARNAAGYPYLGWMLPDS